MTTVVKDWSGKIIAYCEWWVTNGDDRFGGEYVYVRDLWIYPASRNKAIINDLIERIGNHEFAKTCKYVYWNRGGHYRRGEWVSPRVSKPYRITTALRRGMKYGQIEVTKT